MFMRRPAAAIDPVSWIISSSSALPGPSITPGPNTTRSRKLGETLVILRTLAVLPYLCCTFRMGLVYDLHEPMQVRGRRLLAREHLDIVFQQRAALGVGFLHVQRVVADLHEIQRSGAHDGLFRIRAKAGEHRGRRNPAWHRTGPDQPSIRTHAAPPARPKPQACWPCR